MPLYRKRPEVVEAIQVKRGMTVETHRGQQRANPGDYLVRTADGELTVIRQDVFERMYERFDS